MKNILFALIILLSSSAWAVKLPSEWNKLTGASILLHAAAESAQPSPLYCGLNPDEAKDLRAKLEKKIESTMKAWSVAHRHDATYADPSWPVSCQETCSCGLDASLLEHVGIARLGTQDRWIFRRVSTLALEQTPSAAATCASRQTWFCDSSLFKQLRRSK